ncbi:MAG TPA: glycerol-3-phosphate dehydrogenase/oxidase, partial [Desulfuromonadaceae bacterium]|nr:glycerol-3-phosphate dehydrogenase/oxidase [Desulfuromonadaceae bacterium]
IARTHHLSRRKTLEQMPTLIADGLRGGIEFFDGQFDDARLAITLAQTVADHNGAIANYVKVVSVLKRGARINGVLVVDLESHKEIELHARVVINAGGIFSDNIRRLDDHAAETLLAPSQGAHIVLDKSFLPGDHALIIPRTADGRVLFAIPWHGRVLVGTTDTAVNETTLEPRPLPGEIEFLLEHAGQYLKKKPAASDVLSVFAGLRPLIKHPDDPRSAELSRRHEVIVSPAGLVSPLGGKWTTCRMMAEDVVNRAVQVGELRPKPCVTRQLRLHGWQQDTKTPKDPPSSELRTPNSELLLHEYGSDATELQGLCKNIGNDLLHPRLPYRAGQVHWALQREMARTVEDVLSRRLRALLLDARAAIETAPKVARIMAAGLGRDEAWEKNQVTQFQELAKGYCR